MKKTVYLVFCLMFCLLFAGSCSDESVPDETDTAEPTVLTNVFRASPNAIPDGYMMHESIAPSFMLFSVSKGCSAPRI